MMRSLRPSGNSAVRGPLRCFGPAREFPGSARLRFLPPPRNSDGRLSWRARPGDRPPPDRGMCCRQNSRKRGNRPDVSVATAGRPAGHAGSKSRTVFVGQRPFMPDLPMRRRAGGIAPVPARNPASGPSGGPQSAPRRRGGTGSACGPSGAVPHRFPITTRSSRR